VAIGERRKPHPEGKPGYIRIDTVHQGDQDKVKGIYHINAVDEVTQFEIVCSVEKISEQYLMPALEEMLESFPFSILGFHSDNGSEYVNRRVAELLQKLFIEFTKSRSRHSNDNALAESKNASVVRKIFGYTHIPQKWAPKVNQFNRAYLNPYINYHRPCFFPETIINDKGKQQKTYPYRNMMTPFERLKSLPEVEQYLKPEVTLEALDEYALQMSDNEAADYLQKARQQLFSLIFKQDKTG
jgi:transposase InsO family protein